MVLKYKPHFSVLIIDGTKYILCKCILYHRLPGDHYHNHWNGVRLQGGDSFDSQPSCYLRQNTRGEQSSNW